MLRIDSISIKIIILGFALLIPSIVYLRFIDELCATLLITLAAIDCFWNLNFRKYKFLGIILSILLIYTFYSFSLPYNSPIYIIKDFIIEAKPYIPFLVLFAIAPELTPRQKDIIRKIALFNATAMTLTLLGGSNVTKIVVSHPVYGGTIIFVSMMAYLFCSIHEDGTVTRKDLITVALFLTAGLACTRSKYYGIFIISIFFLFIYKPGILKKVTIKHVLGFIFLFGIIVAAVWNKFSYYYLTGNGESFDPTVVETFARPVLYATGALILVDHFPFGSGLASFASFPSGENYSGIYYEYGIDKVYGLSPQMPDFICDAFLPSLAQFGIVGILLFTYFWIYVYGYVKYLIRDNAICYKYLFIIASLIICFILIESTGGNTFTQAGGMISMCFLGIICGKAKNIKAETKQRSIHLSSSNLSLRKI